MTPVPVPVAGEFNGTPGVYRQSVQADLYDNERAAQQTVEAMARHIRYCATDPYIRWVASDALGSWGNTSGLGMSGDGRSRAAWSAWWWAKQNVKFMQDDAQLLRLLNERDQLELLITPSVMVRLETRQGDCDDFTMLVCCLLEALGAPWRIVTIACDPSDPQRWSHVFAAGVMEDGRLVPLDASHGQYPGWHVPNERTFRLQVWDENGLPAGNEVSGMNGIRGLHGYTAVASPVLPVQAAPRALLALNSRPSLPAQAAARARLAIVGGRRMRRRRGVGDDSVDLSSVAQDIGVDPALMNQPLPSPPTTVYVPTGSSSSSTSTWANILGNEAGAFTKIFGQLVAPQTTIQSGPQGTLITGPSGAIAQTSLPALSTAGGFNMSSLLMIGVIGIGAIVLIKAVGK
jgi:hypothetical protein